MKYYYFKIGKINEFRIISWFRTNYRISVKHHNNDKMINGHLPLQNLNPDIIFNYYQGGHYTRFAIECKRRTHMYNMINVCSAEQLDRYQKYAQTCPTYIVLSVGGSIENPMHLYMISIDEVKPWMHRLQLRAYEIDYSTLPFFNAKTCEFSFYDR